jgi:serine-threonine kinase receptor-associated protein
MSSMRQTPLTCSGHTRPVVHLSFSHLTPDGYFMISASKDAKPMLRQGETGDWIGTFEGHKGAVWAATLNSDATRAATGAADFTAKVWNSVNGEEVHSFAHKHIVKCVDFAPDSVHLLTGSNEKLLRIYDLNKPEADPDVLSGHTSNLRCCLWLDNKQKIISASDDKTLRLWDAKNNCEIKKVDLKFPANDIELSGDGRLLTVAYSDRVTFLDAETLEIIKEFVIASPVSSASLHPDRNVFVCGGEDFKMYKCDYESGAELESFKGHFGSVHCVRFSPDGELYASGSEDGTLRLWQTIVGKTYGLWKCMLGDEPITNGDSAIKVES